MNKSSFVLRDVNGGFLKEFDRKGLDAAQSIMTTDINLAYVFLHDSKTFKRKKELFSNLEINPVVVEVLHHSDSSTHQKVTDMRAKDDVELKATSTQVGGEHYQLPIQPIEYIHKNKLGFEQGNIIKYVTRYKQKDGLRDLQKAKHYIDLLIQFEYLDK